MCQLVLYISDLDLEIEYAYGRRIFRLDDEYLGCSLYSLCFLVPHKYFQCTEYLALFIQNQEECYGYPKIIE